MSHYMTALAMKQQGLKPATKIVLYWLADHHNGETLKCYPSIKRLADCCEMSEQSVRNHLKELERLKLIQWSPYYCDDGRQTSNNYYFLFKDDGTVGGMKCYKAPSRKQQGEGTKSVGGRVQNFDPNLVRKNLGSKLYTSSKDDEVNYYFDQLWEMYPRKVGKGQARKAYVTASKKIDFFDLLPKLEAYVSTLDGKDKQYMPHLATWLNGERWADEV